MLCPQCNKSSTKREREGGKCPQCGRPFRFDPPDPLSDYEIEKAISDLSQKGAHKFTRQQLVAEIERHLVKREHKRLDALLSLVTENTAAPYVLAFVALGVAAVMFLVEVYPLTFMLVVAAMGLVVYAIKREAPEVTRRRLTEGRVPHDTRAAAIVSRWVSMGEPKGLLPAERQHATRRKNAREFDLHSFGFDRVVVVQGDETVDMLVANRFHFDHNAAIVSFSGYPSHVAEIVRKQMESGNTHAHVFLLHDASTEGFRLADTWRKSGWAAKSSLVRVGLAPRQVAKVLPVRPPTPGPPPDWVKPEDAAWLQNGSIPLSSMRPIQIMTMLFNAMTNVQRYEDASTGTDFLIVGFDSASDSSFDFG